MTISDRFSNARAEGPRHLRDVLIRDDADRDLEQHD